MKVRTTLQIAKELAYEEAVFSDERATEFRCIEWIRRDDLQDRIQDLDDFLIQWLWNDKGSILSQELAILLEWREKFVEVLSP